MISNLIVGPQREEDEEEVNMVLNVHRTIRLISDGIQEKVNFTILCVSETKPDQEEGGELDSHEEVRCFCGSRQDQGEGDGAGPSS